MTGQWACWLGFDHRPGLSAFISFSAGGMSITHITSLSGTTVHHVCGIWSTNARTKLWVPVMSDRGCLFVWHLSTLSRIRTVARSIMMPKLDKRVQMPLNSNS